MKVVKTSIFSLALMLASAGSVLAEGESAKPLKTADDLKRSIVESVDDIKLQDFNIDDATVEVEFIVNPAGNVAVVSVDGKNCLMNTYVQQMLKDKTIYVTENLSNTIHKVKIRYVRI